MPGQEIPIAMGTMVIVNQRLVDPVALIAWAALIQIFHCRDCCFVGDNHRIVGAEIVDVLAHGAVLNNFDKLLAASGKGE
ncbi:MAG TPA: hypothetical protein VFO22_00550 [Candidatus Udaeobacter sp.]|nr:hypothetical protein [Candidatus Udaeobacter sp.]